MKEVRGRSLLQSPSFRWRELTRIGEDRYIAGVWKADRGFRMFLVRGHQPAGELESPRYGHCFNVFDQFESERSAIDHGTLIATQIADGQVSPRNPEKRLSVREYRLIGSARYRFRADEWEPALRIISRRAANKGAVQEVDSDRAGFLRTTFADEVQALDYALNYGTRMVLGLVGGLTV